MELCVACRKMDAKRCVDEAFQECLICKIKNRFMLSKNLIWMFCCQFVLNLCGVLLVFVSFSHLQMSAIFFQSLHVPTSRFLYNTVMLLIPSYAALLHLCAGLCSRWIAVYSDYTTALTFTLAANGFLMDSLSLTSFRAHLCAAVSQHPAPLLLARDALLIKWRGCPIGRRAQGGRKELIYLWY